jgi:hypothetical protein
MKFAKGQSGNPGGRPKGVDAKARAALEAIAIAGTPMNMKSLADRLWKDAIDGDNDAAEIIYNRLIGKPKQAVDLAGSMLPQAVKIVFDELPDDAAH